MAGESNVNVYGGMYLGRRSYVIERLLELAPTRQPYECQSYIFCFFSNLLN